MIVKVKQHLELRLTIKAGVLGVTGYTGQELVGLLSEHPNFAITALFSTSVTGKFRNILPSFTASVPDIQSFDAQLCQDLDVIFLAVPHTKAMAIVSQLTHTCPKLKIVDLSADFRLRDVGVYESHYSVTHDAADLIDTFVYGLPELYSDSLKQASYCANPGCYATSIILGTLPLTSVIDTDTPIVIDAKSGVSGAGKSLKESSLYCEVNETLSAYATGDHRHMAELVQEVGFKQVMFSPHLAPMDRGIESAIYVYNESMTESELYALYDDYYQDKPFIVVHPSDTKPSTKLVNHTNYCSIIPKKIGNWVVVFSLLDNLVKGASGQAIQNANIMFGLEETAGLI